MKKIILSGLILNSLFFDVAFATGSLVSPPWNTPITLYETHVGKMNYSVIGNSELFETGGYGNCNGGVSSTATLSIPTSATVIAAYLYWYAMEENQTDDNFSYNAISDSAPVIFKGSSLNITATRNSSASALVNGGHITYGGRFADVTAQLATSPNGNYTLDVTGGASSSACALTEENVRGWSLVVVYEDSAITDVNKIYIYDGMVGFLGSSVAVPVTGYHVPSIRTNGSMTVTSIQGDVGLPGEYMNTSDTSFPSFSADYADSSNGAALDIDKLNGDFIANSNSMNLNAGSTGDLILLTNIALLVPTEIDFGDAPASYGEASHTLSDNLYLGSMVDFDLGNWGDGVDDNGDATDDDSTGNNDEDGVTAPGAGLIPGDTETLSISVYGDGVLNAWVDLNQDGDFGDSGEQIVSEQAVSSGTISISVAIPSSVSGNQLYARFRLCSAVAMCNTPAGASDEGEVEDYAFALALSCTALSGDVSQVSAAVPLQVASGDKVFVGSSSPAPNKQGHFKAYSILSNGDVSTTVAWDADDQMDTAERQARLFSSDTSGSKILFNSLDTAAFAISGSDPVVAKIKEYSLNPSVDGGIYLAGRSSGSFLGTLGQGNDVAMLENRVNTWLYLDDSDYRTFASTISSRAQKALVTSDDGFVYAFNQSDGDLVWGWMPRQLVSELKNYDTFQGTRMMSGILDTLEFKYSGSYGSYVIGSYKEGLGQYMLKLDTSNSDALDAVVWDLDYSLVANGAFDTAPNHGEREYFKVNNEAYTAYIVSKSNLSTLVIKKLGDATATTVALNFHVTATPFVMPDFGNSLAPVSRTLYLGAENGDIKRATLFNGSSLETAANIKTALEGTAVGQIGGSSEAITFLGASSAESGNIYYMRAQSEERLTVLKYNTATTNWDHIWTSYASGAGTWDSSDIYTADTSGEPSDDDSDGFFTDVTGSGIQSLPADARITDAARIVAGTVILPISVPSADNCYGTAYYYLYKLNAGNFPVGKFLNLDRSVITGDIVLGYGDPKRVEIADMSSTNQTIGFGNTDQKLDNTTGLTASFVINNNIITGIRGWKERTQ